MARSAEGEGDRVAALCLSACLPVCLSACYPLPPDPIILTLGASHLDLSRGRGFHGVSPTPMA